MSPGLLVILVREHGALSFRADKGWRGGQSLPPTSAACKWQGGGGIADEADEQQVNVRLNITSRITRCEMKKVRTGDETEHLLPSFSSRLPDSLFGELKIIARRALGLSDRRPEELAVPFLPRQTIY